VEIRLSRASAARWRPPPAVAARFTTSEQWVLSVVALEIVTRGACELAVDVVAALPGEAVARCRRSYGSPMTPAARCRETPFQPRPDRFRARW
jgi:hypothetical protein